MKKNFIQKSIKSYTSLKSWLKYGRRFRGYTNPFTLLWIDPHEIQYKSNIMGNFTLWDYAVIDGEWDQNRMLVENLSIYDSLKKRFVEGKHWSQTSYYERIEEINLDNIKQLDSGLSNPSIKDPNLNPREKAYFSQYETLYDQIRENGYMTQRELQQKGLVRETMCPPEALEIAVRITRNGEILFSNHGHHRLSIAKILGLDQIPVRVQIRHSQWERKRHRVASGLAESSDLFEHPDIKSNNK